tara:strand:+ start:1592 stop:1744 length:153 start_codon:yes stop_codon:yes gene_type:complete
MGKYKKYKFTYDPGDEEIFIYAESMEKARDRLYELVEDGWDWSGGILTIN